MLTTTQFSKLRDRLTKEVSLKEHLEKHLEKESFTFTEFGKDTWRTECPFCEDPDSGLEVRFYRGYWVWKCLQHQETGMLPEWEMRTGGITEAEAVERLAKKYFPSEFPEKLPEELPEESSEGFPEELKEDALHISPAEAEEEPEGSSDNDLDRIKKHDLRKYLKDRYGIELDAGGRGLCPFHDDHHPSFNVYLDSNGSEIWLWKCFTCNISGTVIDFVMRKEEISLEEAVRRLKEELNLNLESKPESKVGALRTSPADVSRSNSVEREHIYKDADGKEVFKKVKYESGWSAFHKEGGAWKKNKGDHDAIPYNLDRFEDHRGGKVIVCEGEKDAETVTNLGYLGTSAPWGKGNWSPELTKHFKGFDTITFLYDVGNEGNAREHAEKLKTAYPTTKVSLAKVPMEEREADITDYLEQEEREGRDKALRLFDLLSEAEEIKGAEKSDPIKAKASYEGEKKEAQIKTVEKGSKANLINLKEVEPEPVEWLWLNRIPHRKLSIISGDPGEGKSFFAIFLASCITTGRPYPDGEKPIMGSVIILTAEDGLADTVRPRADANEADVSKITVLESVNDEHGKRFFDVDRDIPILEEAIKRTEGVVLIIIDPITAYLGTKVDSHKNPDVRRVLSPLAKLAEKYGVTILGVSHLNKDVTKKAVYRTQGSLAFMASARSAWVITRDPNDQSRRLFLPVKTNLSIDPSGLAFRIENMKLIFEKEPCSEKAEDALSENKAEEHSRVDLAENFLKVLLADGAVLATEVHKQADDNRHSERTIRRAQERLGIKPYKAGQSWYWELPKQK